MKTLTTYISIFLFSTAAAASTSYHPFAKSIVVDFESGDRVEFKTDYNNVTVTGIKITSRINREYSIPEEAIKGVFAPRFETLRITFHENSNTEFEPGTFRLSFNYGEDSDGRVKDYPDADFFFEQGQFIGKLIKCQSLLFAISESSSSLASFRLPSSISLT